MDISLATERTLEMLNEWGLTDWTFDWSVKAQSFVGDCNYRLKRIRLSMDYVSMNDEKEVMNTIAHEVAHALTPGAKHGQQWKLAMRNMGYYPNLKAPATIKMPEQKWMIMCECGKCTGQRSSKRMNLNNKHHRACGGRLSWKLNPNMTVKV